MSGYENHHMVEVDTKGSLQSARIIVPILFEYLDVKPKSVVDFGCACGAWLKACGENGVEFVCGMDGGYVDQSNLLIDGAHFKSLNLCQPIEIEGKWDMAICLEVVEHLPPEAGASLIRALTLSAPVILFSAAIPGQTGTGHINEQWPVYWQEQFEARGFRRLDPIRRHIWQDRRVEWWYRQNTFVYASESALAHSERLRLEFERASDLADEWVHINVLPHYTSLKRLLRELPHVAWQAIRRRIGRDQRQNHFRRNKARPLSRQGWFTN